MNKSFTSDKVITLDKFWDLTPDSDSGIILTFKEPRQREKTEVRNGKKVKTGGTEDYTYESKTYHPRICQALKEYVTQSMNSSETILEILEKEDKIFELITKLDKEFRQF